MALREDLIASAVEFLKDPSISDSPLNKRIEFIESKGLTQEEIQELLKRAQGQDTVATTSPQTSPVPTVPDYYHNAPQVPDRDWKDYFIMATTTVGVTYGIYQIVTRYVLPNLLPPSKSKLEEEKESIDQEFARVEKLLDNLESKQNQFIEDNNLKAKKIEETLTSIDNIVLKTNEKNLQNEESLKYLKLEIENIKSTMISTLDSQKSNVLQELTSIESELNSLKQIILQSDLKFDDKSKVELKPDEKLDRINIPPASAVPTASEILENSKPDWQKFADKVQEDQPAIPSWQQVANAGASSSSSPAPSATPSTATSTAPSAAPGIPAWQLRS